MLKQNTNYDCAYSKRFVNNEYLAPAIWMTFLILIFQFYFNIFNICRLKIIEIDKTNKHIKLFR